MYKTNLNQRSLRSALLLGAASAAAVSLAAPANAQEQVETVVVTGSRIPQTGLYSTSPVTAVGQQEMKLQGTTNVETLINNLPQAFADFTDTSANGATGTATVDLRGLGAYRTLVLIDGKRLMPGDPGFPVADLNQIPAALVDHVEVLTGGASAVYGSDAEAGVVNFIMRHDFEGVEIDGQYSVDQADNDNGTYRKEQIGAGTAANPQFPYAPKNWWGGATDDATLLVGVNTDNGKGNITAYLGYRNTQAVLESKRDFSACSLTTNFSTGLYCSGSSNYNRWISFDNLVNGNPNWDFFETGTGAKGSGKFVPWGSTSGEHFNYGPLNYLQRPDVRYTGGYFAHYEVNPAVDVYSNFMFTDDHTLAQIAPSGAFLGSGPADFPGTISPGYVQTNCDNPLMTKSENYALCGQLAGDAKVGGKWNGAGNLQPGFSTLWLGRRDIEGGNRIDDLRHTAYRMQIGAKGDLGDGWSYDVYGQYGLSLYSENYSNEWSKQRVENALDVDPATGQCVAKELGIDNQCVPLDLFNGLGAVTPAMENYVEAQGFKSGYTEEQILGASVAGDLGQWGGQLPWAKNPIGVALGAEWRDETLQLDTSRDFQINDLYGQGGATLPVPKSSFNVSEIFGEVRIPIVQGQPFFEDLTVNGGYRYSSYSTVGFVASYKYGAEWQPIDDFRIRASYQRAVRAPNVLESFSPLNVALFGGNDPCAGAPTPSCIAHGVTNAISCPASQCNARFGGNANLKPETSDTRSVGIVLTPTFLPGFTATVDYWNIKIADYISINDPNVTLAGCYGSLSTAAQQAFYCPLVHRTLGGTGSVFGSGYVDAITTNLPALKTDGVDFEANYQADFDDWGMSGWGSLAANFEGTLVNNNEVTPSTAAFQEIAPSASSATGYTALNSYTTSYQCAGYYGPVCGTPTPKWRHKLRVTWSTPWDVDISLDWRHLSGVKLDENTTDAHLNVLSIHYCQAYGICNGDPVDAAIGAFDYFDLSANWTVRDGVEIRAGVNNIFDKEPPTVDANTWSIAGPPFGNGNTYPGVYDSLGRTIFVGATLKY